MGQHCSMCGSELRDGALFCAACGEKIHNTPDTSPAADYTSDTASSVVQSTYNKERKSKRKILYIVAAVGLLIIIAILILSFSRSINTPHTPNTPNPPDVSSAVGAFKYINKSWDDFAYLNPVKNGAIQNLSGVGFDVTEFESYRSNTENTDARKTNEVFFGVRDDTVIAAMWSTDSSQTVGEFLQKEYPQFVKQEPIMENKDNDVAVTMFWQTEDGCLCIWGINNSYPNEIDCSEISAAIVVEYGTDVDYEGGWNNGKQTVHPQNLTECLTYLGYSTSDVAWGGYWEMMETLFDVYSWENGIAGLLFVEAEAPYRVYMADSLQSGATLLWENGVPVNLNNGGGNNHTNSIIAVDDEIYMWKNSDVFEVFFAEYHTTTGATSWEHLGIKGDYYFVPGESYPGWFDLYCVDFSNGDKTYYAIPYGEIQLTDVYEIGSENELTCVWSTPINEYYPWMADYNS